MRTIDWAKHKAHREQVMADHGQWMGLLDEDGVPIMSLPQVTDMDWPTTRGVIDSVSTTLHTRTPSQRPHGVVAELVADGLGNLDEIGRLEPNSGPTRMIALERPGMKRETMRVTHAEAEGDSLSPHTLTIHGITLNGTLDMLPCPSNPLSWTGDFTRFDRDWVGDEEGTELFEKPRDLASFTMITVADGASVDGPAADVVIHRIIDESLAAVHRVAGITDHPPYVAVLADRGHRQSPRLILRPTDQTIWQEVGEAALVSGVAITADLWWPGDQPVPGHDLSLPTIVFTVKQEVDHA